MGTIEFILVVALLIWAFGSSGKKKTKTHHYSGGYTINHTPPPVDESMPTQKFEGGYNGELNKEFENK